MNPFEYLNSINYSKKDIMIDDAAEKAYSGFMVNRGLSYFHDTVLIANEMNINHHIDHRLQYDFMMNIVTKKKRYSKWLKSNEELNSINTIKEYYGYSDEKAKSILPLLSHEQLNELKLRIYKGGKRK
jgi:uncharacterized membrane-anchored protein YitT (DUF2179 family)